MATGSGRRLPVGAEVTGEGVSFRVWAPAQPRVEVVIDGGPGAPATVGLSPDGDGYFAGGVPGAGAGSRYRFRLGDDGDLWPDPASRAQPDGPYGASEVVDPGRFGWTDGGWRGRPLAGSVLYELHVGTFTREGTWAAAAERLPDLAELGVTVVEMMPVNEFAGEFGWGYDGVHLFAPYRGYGTPDDLRRFVDRAHALGVAVILDVVYNHFGPAGNSITRFAGDYCTDRHKTDWGAAINFDGPNSAPVREYFLANADYWIREFHFDGLRLDATQNIYDDTDRPIIAEISRTVRAAAGGRATILLAENEAQDVRHVRPIEAGGLGLDGLWNDDYHHVARVALTGRREGYYVDYTGAPPEWLSAVRWGYLYQGQVYVWYGGGRRRGTPAFDVAPYSFVTFIQNHDQIANSGRGDRLHRLTSPGRYRAATLLTLLAPSTPMLFQGQEWAASTPFLYFADHEPDLARLVREGRAESLGRFPSLKDPAMRPHLADPDDPDTFRRSQLDWSERERPGHAAALALHRDLLRLRRDDPVFAGAARASRAELRLEGTVLGPDAFALRWFGHEGDDRLVVVNLGRDLHLYPVPDPLLAPPAGRRWRPLLSTEDPRYGGTGTPPLDTDDGWHLPAETAVALTPVEP